MLKNVVLAVSGIVSKMVIKYMEMNDFILYVLKEDDTKLRKHYGEDGYKNYINVFVEVNDHLLFVCRASQIEMLKQYTKEQILETLTQNFIKALENKTANHLGMAQYLNMVSEFEAVQEFKKNEKLQKELDKQKEREEKDRQKELEWNNELDQAAKDLLEGKRIECDYFLGLLDRHELKLPIRTRGWANNSLVSVTDKTYRYCGNPSKVIMNYVEELVCILKELNEVEQNEETLEQPEEMEVENKFNKDKAIALSTPKEQWEALKEGKQILLNNNEIDSLQEYIDTLDDTEQDLYYMHFASLFDKSLVYGLLSRCYICKLNNYQVNEIKSPEQKFMNDEKITNVEFLELLDKYDIEISYSLLNWIKEKLDAVGLGQYTYRASFKGSFPNELSNIVDQLYDAIKEGETASQSHNETIIENMLNHFNELSTSNTLEVFGQITLKIQSWFKLVKYDSKVHAVITLGNEKLELFDEYEKVKNDCIEWLKDQLKATPASENVTPNTDNEYDLIIMNQSNNHGYLILNGMYKGKSVTIEQDSSVNLLEIYGDITEHEEDIINDLYINNRFIIHKDSQTA